MSFQGIDFGNDHLLLGTDTRHVQALVWDTEVVTVWCTRYLQLLIWALVMYKHWFWMQK